ncbi:MAG TPA: hypothetical protein VFR32_12145 [Gaiellaceae bacterium]|nr:hypothetical protein [Gaiellaceae bacterium]
MASAPHVGEDVYVPSSLHVTHGVDDFRGGLCRVVAVRELLGSVYVEVEEDPVTLHGWAYLEPLQDELRFRYGDERGRPDPDRRPEFNEGWTG